MRDRSSGNPVTRTKKSQIEYHDFLGFCSPREERRTKNTARETKLWDKGDGAVGEQAAGKKTSEDKPK